MKYIWEKMDQNVCKKIPIFDPIYVFNLKVYLNLANKLYIIAKDERFLKNYSKYVF